MNDEICPTNKIESSDSEEDWDSERKNNESIVFNREKEGNIEEENDDKNNQNINRSISLKNSSNNSIENFENCNNIEETTEKDLKLSNNNNSPYTDNKKNNKQITKNNLIFDEKIINEKSNINTNNINFKTYNFQDIVNKNNINRISDNNDSIIINKAIKDEDQKDINNIVKKDSNNNASKIFDISNIFKKSMCKKEIEISEFENIELPKESKTGEFIEIKGPYIFDNDKEKNKINEMNKRKQILETFYKNRADLKRSVNNNHSNFYNKYFNDDLLNENLYKTCINLPKKNNEINLIKIMSVLKSSNIQTWKDNLKSFVSSLYYNGYGLSKRFDKNEPELPIYIFESKIDKLDEQINFLLKTFLYMSYRSGFINLNCIGCGDYSSDCGWGCMIRACQMILSKGLIQKKIFDFFREKNALIDKDSLRKIRIQILDLFSDYYIPYKELKDHPDFKYFWEKYKDLSKTNPEYKSISEIIPPYSIHILCKLGKFSGEYTSDIKIIRLFTQINSQIFNDFNIMFFECGYISKKKLITNFCEEYIDFNSNYLDTITYNGVDYIFKKGGIVFISFRLGLYDLDPSFYDIIPLIFKKFRNNLGFVCGKKNRAYYFIGVQENNKLIFVDPHYNQLITNNSDRDYESYYTDNIYLLDIKDLSSEFTLGIGIYNAVQFNQFFEDLKWFNDNFKDLNFITIGND